jgi:chromatin segregation and condensation protein Rec8/ScpA/Scc1 (kleisin family)
MSVLAARRSYATTTRATKPTATVKKAVKQTATAKTPAPKKKAAPAKKPVKKPAARKPAAKRAAPKKPVKRVKKELTPEEKAKADIRALRAKALKEPTNLRALSAYNIFVAEKVTNTKATLTEVSKDFKALSPAQIEVSQTRGCKTWPAC